MTTNGRAAHLAVRLKENNDPLRRYAGDGFTSRGAHGLSLGSPPPRATTGTPESLAIAAEGADSLDTRRNERQRRALKGAAASAVRAAIDDLLPREQQAVMRAYLQALEDESRGARRQTWVDIAVRLDVHPDTVKSRFRLAKAKIEVSRPAWRDMFPLDVFTDAPDEVAIELDRQFEVKHLSGGDRWADDRRDADDWHEEHGYSPGASADVRTRETRTGDVRVVAGELSFTSDRAEFTAETVPAEDERHATREDPCEKEGRGTERKRRKFRRPGIPTHIDKDLRWKMPRDTSIRLSAQQRALADGAKLLSDRARAQTFPDADVTQSDFAATAKRYQERLEAERAKKQRKQKLPNGKRHGRQQW
jgi:hypothetical protein